MSILKIRDENGNIQEILAIRGEPGKDYVLTEEDKREIAGMIEPGSGGDGEVPQVLIVKLSTHDYQEFDSSHSYEDIIQAFNNKKIINLLLDEYVFVLDAQYSVVDGEELHFVSQMHSSDFENDMCAIRKLLFKSDNSIEFSGNPIYLTDIDTVVSLIDDSKILMISVIYDDSQDLYILSHSVEEIKNAHNENKIIYAYYEGITYPFTYIESDVITFETYDSNGYHRLNICYDEELEQSVVDIVFDKNGRLVNDWELEGRFEEVNEQIAGITYEQIGAAPAEEVSKLNKFITPEMYGAAGDGVTDDSVAFNQMLADEDKRYYPILLTAKKYGIGSKIIDTLGHTIFSNNSELVALDNFSSDYMFEVNIINKDTGKAVREEQGVFRYYLNMDCSHICNGFNVFNSIGNKFSLAIKNAKQGFCLDRSIEGNVSYENEFDIRVDSIGRAEDVGIYIDGHDDYFNNVIVINYKTAIKTRGNSHYKYVHCWLDRNAKVFSEDGSEWMHCWEDSVCIEDFTDAPGATIDFLYVDTYKYGIYTPNYPSIHIGKYYSLTGKEELEAGGVTFTKHQLLKGNGRVIIDVFMTYQGYEYLSLIDESSSNFNQRQQIVIENFYGADFLKTAPISQLIFPCGLMNDYVAFDSLPAEIKNSYVDGVVRIAPFFGDASNFGGGTNSCVAWYYAVNDMFFNFNVNITTSNWKPMSSFVTPKKIGAAPSGYGLGENAKWIDSIKDSSGNEIGGWNQALKSGFYSSSYNCPPKGKNHYIGIVISYVEGTGIQIAWEAYPDAGENIVFMRIFINNEFRQWEEWSPSIFAPAGYGFGEKEAQAMNWNSHYRSGIYKERANSPDGAALWYGLTCVSHYGESADLAFSPDETNGFTMAVRHQKNGAHQEWEYVNPPLNSGVIYRTTERQYGLPVYKKIENGTLYYSIDKGVTWKPYNQFVNAAPAGYGLGGHGRTAADFNECILSGFYSSATSGAINGPKEWDNMKYGVLLVENRDGSIIYQRLTYDSYSAMRWSNDVGTTWSDWYWETPPYETGKVYKTTKRYRMMTLYERVNPDTFIIEYSTDYSIAEDGTESGTWYNYAQLFGLNSYIDTKIEETILGGSW